MCEHRTQENMDCVSNGHYPREVASDSIYRQFIAMVDHGIIFAEIFLKITNADKIIKCVSDPLWIQGSGHTDFLGLTVLWMSWK